MNDWLEANLKELLRMERYQSLVEKLRKVKSEPLPIPDDFNWAGYADSVTKYNRISGYENLRTVVMLGFEYGFAAEDILRKCISQTTILVIESNFSSLKFSLSRRDLRKVITDPRLVLLVNEHEALNHSIENFFYEQGSWMLTNRVLFVSQPIYSTCDPNYGNRLKEKFIEARKAFLYMLGNNAEDSMLGLINMINNFQNLIESYPLDQLHNQFKGRPAVCVAAGPSLEKNISILKIMQKHAVIIACDTIAERLRREGVIPDFITTLERGTDVYQSFYKDKEFDPRTILVGLSLIDSDILKEYPGRMSVVSPERMPFDNWVKESFPNLTFLDAGKSGAHLNYSLAQHLGCEPIVLVGQDLAYGIEGNTHAKGTYDENQYFLERPELKIVDWENRFEIPGYYGQPVLSNRFWVMFKEWFEQKIIDTTTKCINATEGGAFIQGAEHISLQEIYKRYCDYPLDRTVIDKICNSDSDKEAKLSAFKIRVQEKLDRNRNGKEKLKEILQESDTIVNIERWNSNRLDVLTKIIELDHEINVVLGTDMNLAQIVQYPNFTYRSKLNRLIELSEFKHVQLSRDYLQEFISTIIQYAERITELYEHLLIQVEQLLKKKSYQQGLI